ncbi:MAG: SRPBCC family protein [Ignavibacteria bacterium]|nr:SRPBCC family protein [Ignavibacteria bacterium]
MKKITPSFIKAEILKIELPLKLHSDIELAITQFGLLKTVWKIKLTAFDPYTLITDTQVMGPFKKWVHDHCFEDINGKTLMTDRIDYELPFGVFGKIGQILFVKRMIEKQFEFRQKITKEILENS